MVENFQSMKESVKFFYQIFASLTFFSFLIIHHVRCYLLGVGEIYQLSNLLMIDEGPLLALVIDDDS